MLLRGSARRPEIGPVREELFDRRKQGEEIHSFCSAPYAGSVLDGQLVDTEPGMGGL